MNKHLRADTSRRRDAIDRLRSLTTGAVFAGAAGTVGFGLLAAATFRGTTSTEAATTGETQAPTTRSEEGGTGSTRNQANGNATIPGLGTAPTPRPTATHKSHAATGGSG
jgi:hypothetical protein